MFGFTLPRLLIVVASVFMCSVAQAVIITVSIEATVTVFSDSDNLLGGVFGVGDTVTGSYTYDTSISDNNGSANVGDYFHTSAPAGISVSVGGLTFETDPSNVDFLVEIVNDFSGQDGFLVRSFKNLSLPSGVLVDRVSFALDDLTATAISSIALPLGPPVLSDYSQTFGGVNVIGCDVPVAGSCSLASNQFRWEAEISSLRLVSVPEPSTLALLGAGLLGLFIRRKRVA